MIQLTGEKMAKSAGNIAPLHEVLASFGSEAVLMFLISGHYRQPLAFSDATLEQARANVTRIREAARRLSPGDSPADSHLREMLSALGLESLLAPSAQPPAQVRSLAEQRERARGERDFAA